MLIAFGGLPGTGKTTVARALARRLEAVHVRLDTRSSRRCGLATSWRPMSGPVRRSPAR